jgi:hypothetical protein
MPARALGGRCSSSIALSMVVGDMVAQGDGRNVQFDWGGGAAANHVQRRILGEA